MEFVKSTRARKVHPLCAQKYNENINVYLYQSFIYKIQYCVDWFKNVFSDTARFFSVRNAENFVNFTGGTPILYR